MIVLPHDKHDKDNPKMKKIEAPEVKFLLINVREITMIQFADLTAFSSRLLFYEKLKKSVSSSDPASSKLSRMTEFNINEQGLEYKGFKEMGSSPLHESEDIAEEVKTSDTCSVEVTGERDKCSIAHQRAELEVLYTEIEHIFMQDDELLVRILRQLQGSHIGHLLSLELKVRLFTFGIDSSP